jgi:hypothetical protein
LEQITPATKSRREQLWEVVLSKEEELRNSIQDATEWEPKDIPCKLDALYTALSNQVHTIPKSSDGEEVPLVVGVASRKDCAALACIAKAVDVATRVFPFLDDE